MVLTPNAKMATKWNLNILFYIKKSLANHVLKKKSQKNVFLKKRLLGVI